MPIESLLQPLSLLASLFLLGYASGGHLDASYVMLYLALFTLALPAGSQLLKPTWRFCRDLLPSWALMAVLLGSVVAILGHTSSVDVRLLTEWASVGFLSQVITHAALRRLGPVLACRRSRSAVIAGLNDDGVALAEQMLGNPYMATRLVGYFDDRSAERSPAPATAAALPRLGKMPELPQYARHHHVDVVYLCLPMAREARVLDLLEQLCDSTASIYFVPRLQVTELMQGRIDAIGNLSVVTVCETPFRGLNAVVKRASDIVLATLILIAIAPLLVLIGVAVRADSLGPVMFRQRRYGLGGEEILVTKFRTMRVLEDGGEIRQATRDDHRITRVGRLLRRSSLDELPQFFDVLRGCMSIVGPRPHAVAHNELYRKVIKGYMLRHKVKPGITGWAQVNGCRGETDTVEKMKLRIEYDLAYIRGWSLMLDLYIVAKTAVVVFRDRAAY